LAFAHTTLTLLMSYYHESVGRSVDLVGPPFFFSLICGKTCPISSSQDTWLPDFVTDLSSMRFGPSGNEWTLTLTLLWLPFPLLLFLVFSLSPSNASALYSIFPSFFPVLTPLARVIRIGSQLVTKSDSFFIGFPLFFQRCYCSSLPVRGPPDFLKPLWPVGAWVCHCYLPQHSNRNWAVLSFEVNSGNLFPLSSFFFACLMPFPRR